MLEVVKAEIPDVCTLNAEVDQELSGILRKMIAKDPAERYQSCQELVADLQRHPLVARGGPITLQTKMTAAAATMIGQKTPVSGQRPLPSTTPTPQPMATMATPNPANTPARGQPGIEPAVHQSVLERGAPARSPLPLAIAAVAFLLLVGGAWAFRDQILVQLGQVAPSQIAAPPADAPATTVAATPVAPVPPPAPTAPPPPSPPAPATASTDANSNASNAAAGASVADILAGSAQPSQAGAKQTDAAPANAAAVAAANNAAASAGPAPRASQVEPLRDLPAAQAAQASAKPRVAAATPPAPVSAPPRPHVPTIAVISGGDTLVSEPAERAIEEALARKGYHLIDQSMMPRVEHMMSGSRANIAGILDLLAQHRSNVDAVVVVHVRPAGEQQITFYGQSDTLKTAQLDVTAYAVEGRGKLGAGWSDNVNFTAMSARDKAREAVEPMLGEIEERLSEFRPAGHKG